MEQSKLESKESFGAENANHTTQNPEKNQTGSVDQVGILFKEKFQETYGHTIQRGNLHYTLKQGVALQ